MGGISAPKSKIIDDISKIVAYKTGLSISVERFLKLIGEDEDYAKLFCEPPDGFVHIDSVTAEEIVTFLLYRLGAKGDPFLNTDLLVPQFPSNQTLADMAHEIGYMYLAFLQGLVDNPSQDKIIDPMPFFQNVSGRFGLVGRLIALDIVARHVGRQIDSPWGKERTIDWEDTRELDELFKSENLTTKHGDYFDQRFINFLYENFDEIDSINWRQFEGLAGEFLQRSGLHIEMGPGRDDGNIDIRAWSDRENRVLPPTLIVQCKRQKEKVGKVVVKALWADLQYEGAKSGLIVTTSELAPGAKRVCEVRSYAIDEASRETVKEWIAAMRTPGSGII